MGGTGMNRFQYYKHRKRRNKGVLLAFILTFIVLISGILTADYAVNSMLGLPSKMNIFSCTQKKDYVYRITLMNCSGDFNLTYVKKDLDNVNAWVEEKYQGIQRYVVKISDHYSKAVANMK